MIILTGTLILLYSNQVYQQEEQRLREITQKTETLYLDSTKGKIEALKLQDYMDAMAYVSKSKLYILNINEDNIQNLKDLDFDNSDLDNYLYEDLSIILEGNEVFRKSTYTATFDSQMIFYGRPILKNGQIEGVVVIFTPISTVVKNIRVMLMVIASLSVFFIFIVSGVLYVSAKKMTKPIEDISNSALAIANGEILEDMTKTGYYELNALIDSFNYMKSELNRIDEDKKAFIGMISHEIKTPLTVISGYLEAIHDGLLDKDELDESLEIIYRETKRLTQLTKEIVTKTKNKDMEFYLNPSFFKLKPILEEMIKLSKVNIEKHIDFSLSCDDNTTLYADEKQLRQILSNLFSNAIKYSGDSVHISLSCFVEEEQLCIRVEDDGLGIKKDELEKVFQKYYRIKNTVTRQEGSGLGLSIVKKLVDLHHGTIDITSTYKKGTIVTVKLPPLRQEVKG
jgi:signal transduction histidine kinase